MMLLYVCKECGHWGDMTLTESIGRGMALMAAALSNKALEPTARTYDCPAGHGPMTLVKPEHRLMTWDAELGLKPSMRIVSVGSVEPQEKHYGNLDRRHPHDDWHGEARIIENYGLCDGSHVVEINGGYGDCENSHILLDPAQALSLLSWLEQEKPTLMQLVKEQAEKTE